MNRANNEDKTFYAFGRENMFAISSQMVEIPNLISNLGEGVEALRAESSL
jgi:hypothetical protein